jgi:hypothetical protein
MPVTSAQWQSEYPPTRLRVTFSARSPGVNRDRTSVDFRGDQKIIRVTSGMSATTQCHFAASLNLPRHVAVFQLISVCR